MDELKFRRQAYGDPNCQDDDFLTAMQATPEHNDFVNELKKLDKKLELALKIDVPDDLAAKLLLNQQLHQHQKLRRKSGFALALVASITFIAGISFTLLRMAPVNLGQHALSHIYHDKKALSIDQNVSFKDVNFQLASLDKIGNARFTQQPGKGKVYFSTLCDFQGVKSLHLVIQGEHGKVTLFIVPAEDRMVLEQAFANNKYQGRGFKTDNAYMLLVSEKNANLSNVEKEIKKIFI